MTSTSAASTTRPAPSTPRPRSSIGGEGGGSGGGGPSMASPIRWYFSRQRDSRHSTIPALPVAVDFRGSLSPWGVLWGCIFLVVPLSYCYILLVMLCELCRVFPLQIYAPLQRYLPRVALWMASLQEQRSIYVETWCYIEAIFYLACKLQIQWLQARDPLEHSFRLAPIMRLEERAGLFRRLTETERQDPVSFVTGWFFDVPLTHITRFDVCELIAWSMFECRHQEHLTTAELEQMEDFVADLEVLISLHLYGPAVTDHQWAEENPEETERTEQVPPPLRWRQALPKPKKMFHFPEETHNEEPNFFTNLFESSRHRYEQMMKHAPDFHQVMKHAPDFQQVMKHAPDFHPVQDFRNLVAGTAQHLVEAEESAMATASQMYETLIPTGSLMEKRLSAMSHATYGQMVEAWNSVKDIKDQLEIARFLAKRRHRLRQQSKGYRVMLNRLLELSSSVPPSQMAALMRRITECNEALENLENSAKSSFMKLTGFALNSLPFFQRKEPQRFAKYSSDPLLGLATYPLGFQLLVLGLSNIPLRIMMFQRGFEHLSVGSISYYYHIGLSPSDGDVDHETKTPVVFVHGIGIGLIPYMPLIDALLKSGRPILLPELPFVSGFRPWQAPYAVLTPFNVVATMTALLATHGLLRATWMGHSYGSSWVSYMIQHAPETVAAVVLLDPICFCMHVPFLTKQFVYMKPDPGTVSYMVRTDVIVNWTIQRATPWARISLFVEQIEVPCAVFLSDKDALVPAVKVEAYLRGKQVPVRDFSATSPTDFAQGQMNCTVFRGDGHGGWTERPSQTVPLIAAVTEVLGQRAEKAKSS